MRNRKILQQVQRLQFLIKRSQEACGDNIELQSHWAKYLCVLSAGLIENAIKEIYIEFAHETVSKPIASFVGSNIGKISSPRTQRFLEVAATFKPTWKEELEAFVSDNGRESAIDSIMRNRHLIAHGKETDSRITIVQIKDYFDRAVEVLEFIEDQCSK